jgi:kumamolisin
MKRRVVCFFALAYATVNAAAPKAVDLGPLAGHERNAPISITVRFALPGLSEAEKLQQAIYTPGDPEYHHFLTTGEFNSRFGPKEEEVSKAIAAFGKYGLSAERITGSTLRVTGTPAALEQAFSISLHTYEAPAAGKAGSYRFRAAVGRPTLPAEIPLKATAVTGFNNHPALRPLHRSAPAALHNGPGATTFAKTGDAFGNLTVLDFASNYNVDPLYAAGMTGSGHTLGIMTLASFTASDAYGYWTALGLHVANNRIEEILVDGGSGPVSDDAGSLETTLDVEQSGGIAPGAHILVYEAPNTDQGFVDVFAKAIHDNKADTLSISWGDWEAFQDNTVSSLTAIHELLLQAALQGQTVFAASGDGGAYDVSNDLGCAPPACTATLTVDYPASDPLITAAGGTTLAGHQSYCLTAACTAPLQQVQTQKESVWGWDYLIPLCSRLGFDPITCGIFPAGSGGGVSVFFGVPDYQKGVSGIQLSQPGQVLSVQGIGTIFSLPANYAGRNVPDVSFNADPETGYLVVYTSSVSGFGAQPFWGGTSFVAPQLNGVAALLDQYVGKRVGFLNPALYKLAASNSTNSPLNAVTAGDNWFYAGSKAYNPAAGLGTLDVYNFALYLKGIL